MLGFSGLLHQVPSLAMAWKKLCSAAELDLYSTLKSAQCFRWSYSESSKNWNGAIGGYIVSLKHCEGTNDL
jgi:hypothetical protein